MRGGRFKLDAVLRVTDRITRPIRQIERRMGRFTRSVSSGFRQVGSFVRQFRFAFLGMAAAVGVAAAGLVRALHDVVSVGMDFEQAMVSAASKLTEPIRAGTEEFRRLEDAAKEVGATTEFSATQAAGALEKLIMGGFDAEQAIAALPGAADLASAAQMDLVRAIDISTDLLGSFSLQSADAAEQARNLARVNDVLIATQSRANATLEDLFMTWKEAGPAATALGEDIETVASLSAVLANAGIKNSQAGTAMRAAFVRLSSPAGEAARMLRRLGVATQDAEGDFVGIMPIIRNLSTALEGMGSAERQNVIKRVFGEEALAAVNVLLAGVDGLGEFREGLDGITGATREMAAATRDTTSGDLRSFGSAIEAVKISIFEVVKGPLREIVRSLTGWVRANKDVIASGITDFLGWLEENTWAVKAALVVLVGVLATLAVILGFIALAMFVVALPLLIFIGVVYAAIRAFEALWEAVEPIIGAIGAKLTDLWERLKSGFTAAIEFVVGLFVMLRDAVMWHLQPIIGAASAVAGWFIETWRPVGDFFVGLWDGISSAFGAAWSYLLGYATQQYEALTAIWTPIADFFAGLWNSIAETFGEIFGAVVGKIGEVVGVVRGVGRAELEGEGGADPVRPQVVSPQERVARSISERTTTTRNELIVRPEGVRAEMRRPPRRGSGLIMPDPSAEFAQAGVRR